jgi:hypothetical protein
MVPYHSSVPQVTEWIMSLQLIQFSPLILLDDLFMKRVTPLNFKSASTSSPDSLIQGIGPFFEATLRMLSLKPDERPTSAELSTRMKRPSCCLAGREEFREEAGPDMLRGAIYRGQRLANLR